MQTEYDTWCDERERVKAKAERKETLDIAIGMTIMGCMVASGGLLFVALWVVAP